MEEELCIAVCAIARDTLDSTLTGANDPNFFTELE